MHYSDAENLENRWPTDGDRLFVSSSASGEAPIVADPGERRYRLPMGYKRAGDILIEQVATSSLDNRNVIYAAIYCYRHSIELFMKQILDRFGSSPSKRSHELPDLWKDVTNLMRSQGVEHTVGLNAVGALLFEMHEADMTSTGFRYPTDRRGAPFQFETRLDVQNLKSVVQGLTNFFECCYLDLQSRE